MMSIYCNIILLLFNEMILNKRKMFNELIDELYAEKRPQFKDLNLHLANQ